MKPKVLLARLASGHLDNVAFRDFTLLVEQYGFRCLRTSGSHAIYSHPRIPDLVNLQPHRGKAKPYQIRQFLRLVHRYNLVPDWELEIQ